MMNLFEEIERTARARGAALALDCAERGRFTFVDLLANSASYAGALTALGVEPGDRVTVVVDKEVDSVWLYLAVLRIGAIYMPLNTGYTDAEMEYFIGDAEPALIVVKPERVAAVAELSASVGVDARVMALPAVADLARDSRPYAGVFSRSRDDTAAILYTSGTTGRSKGAMISHGNLISNARTLVEIWQFRATDVLVHALPIYHVHGLFVALHCALFAGAAIRFLPRFDIDAVLAALPAASVFMGVPTYYTRLLAAQQFPTRDVALRLWISGSAPLSPDTFAAFEQRTGAAILPLRHD
jgi:malonyl-CoA/methylmalonyl-CoA synthetase